jgi:hypothetical protein
MNNGEAARILEALAGGCDPDTGAKLPKESILQNADVIRALYCAVQELKRATEPDALTMPGRENAGRAWSEHEINQLLREFEGGMTPSEMAKRHGRTLHSIHGRLYRLGKVPAWRPGMKIS